MKQFDWIQLIGMIVVITGVIYEIIYQAPLGFIFITFGSVLFAIGTKLKGR